MKTLRKPLACLTLIILMAVLQSCISFTNTRRIFWSNDMDIPMHVQIVYYDNTLGANVDQVIQPGGEIELREFTYSGCRNCQTNVAWEDVGWQSYIAGIKTVTILYGGTYTFEQDGFDATVDPRNPMFIRSYGVYEHRAKNQDVYRFTEKSFEITD